MDLDSFNEVVRTFNKTFKQKPDFRLRRKLIAEEYLEWKHAFNNEGKERAGKELADLLFVVLGAFDALGLDLDASILQVATKNWNKIQNAHLMQTDGTGKVIKPAGDDRFS